MTNKIAHILSDVFNKKKAPVISFPIDFTVLSCPISTKTNDFNTNPFFFKLSHARNVTIPPHTGSPVTIINIYVYKYNSFWIKIPLRIKQLQTLHTYAVPLKYYIFASFHIIFWKQIPANGHYISACRTKAKSNFFLTVAWLWPFFCAHWALKCCHINDTLIFVNNFAFSVLLWNVKNTFIRSCECRCVKIFCEDTVQFGHN